MTKRQDIDNETLLRFLTDKNACPDALTWIEENNYTFRQAWENCPDHDWMLWLLNHITAKYDPREALHMTVSIWYAIAIEAYKDYSRPTKTLQRTLWIIHAILAGSKVSIDHLIKEQKSISSYAKYPTKGSPQTKGKMVFFSCASIIYEVFTNPPITEDDYWCMLNEAEEMFVKWWKDPIKNLSIINKTICEVIRSVVPCPVKELKRVM